MKEETKISVTMPSSLFLTCLGNLKYLLTLIDKRCAAGDHPLADFILYNKEHFYEQRAWEKSSTYIQSHHSTVWHKLQHQMHSNDNTV